MSMFSRLNNQECWISMPSDCFFLERFFWIAFQSSTNVMTSIASRQSLWAGESSVVWLWSIHENQFLHLLWAALLLSLIFVTNQAFDDIIFNSRVQENVHPLQPSGKGHVAPARGSRPVLGEISQNVTARRQPLRSSKQVCRLRNINLKLCVLIINAFFEAEQALKSEWTRDYELEGSQSSFLDTQNYLGLLSVRFTPTQTVWVPSKSWDWRIGGPLHYMDSLCPNWYNFRDLGLRISNQACQYNCLKLKLLWGSKPFLNRQLLRPLPLSLALYEPWTTLIKSLNILF